MPESTITHPRFSRKRVSNICLSHDAQQPRATAAQSEIITSENQNFNAGAALSYSLCSECTDRAEPKLSFSSIFLKKVLAFSRKMMYYLGVRFVGQAVKTPPSHGGNRGSSFSAHRGIIAKSSLETPAFPFPPYFQTALFS